MTDGEYESLGEKKSGATYTLIIILAIILIIFCCCCLFFLLAGWYAGDYVIDWLRMFINIGG